MFADTIVALREHPKDNFVLLFTSYELLETMNDIKKSHEGHYDMGVDFLMRSIRDYLEDFLNKWEDDEDFQSMRTAYCMDEWDEDSNFGEWLEGLSFKDHCKYYISFLK